MFFDFIEIVEKKLLSFFYRIENQIKNSIRVSIFNLKFFLKTICESFFLKKILQSYKIKK